MALAWRGGGRTFRVTDSGFDVLMDFEDGKKLEKLLDEFPLRIQKRILKAATRSAAMVVVKQARQNLDSMGAVDSGLLKKSLTAKVKLYGSGIVNAAIGPHKKNTGAYVRDRGQLRWREPKKYAHLVELGTFRTRPKPFLRNALLSTMPPMIAKFKQMMGKRLIKEGQKLGRELRIPA